MALRQAGLIFRAEAVATLRVSARAQESLRIKRIFLSNIAGGAAFVTLVSDTSRVGFFRAATLGGRHLMLPREQEHTETVRGTNLLDFMTAVLGFAGYPVAAGENFDINLDVGTADMFVVADLADSADNVRTQPNGAGSKDLTWVNYGTNLAAIAAAGYSKLDSSRNPAEMIRFPFGAVGAGLVPAAQRISLLAVGGQAVGRFVSAGNTANTGFLRIKKGQPPGETLLDRGDVGYPFFGTVPGAAGADYTSTRQAIASNPRMGQLMDLVVPALEFGPNDEMALQVSVLVAGAGQLNANDADVWVILRTVPA